MCIDMNVIWLILNLSEIRIQLAETVSVAGKTGKWVNTDLIENHFYGNTTTGNNSSTDVPLLR